MAGVKKTVLSDKTDQSEIEQLIRYTKTIFAS